MKKLIYLLMIVIPAFGCGDSNPSAVESETDETVSENEFTVLDINELESNLLLTGELSESEKAGLIHMREEEKLARDVYKFLAEKYNTRIFYNIMGSEENHMAAVKVLLEAYGLEDPIKEIGIFSDPDLQKLYDAMTDEAETSYEDAIKYGLSIEDLDIFDLEKLIGETANPDLLFVYNNLLKASGNHLRAFFRNAQSIGVEYFPQYISQEKFDLLLAVGNAGRYRGR